MATPPLNTPGAAQHTLDDRLRLPGMLPPETVVFKAWWAAHASEYTGYDFNVRVGTGFDPGDAFDDATRKAAIDSTKKRIDALLWKGSQAYIVEVKLRVTPVVIGQVLSYSLLWTRDNPTLPKPNLRVISCLSDADTDYCLDQLGIAHEIVFCDLRKGLMATKA